MNMTQFGLILVFIGLLILIMILVIGLPNVFERDRLTSEFCNEELYHYSFNRTFCDGKEYICNSKQCWWIK